MNDSTATPDEMRRQLARMLRAEEIVVRPKVARLLRFFVEESIRNGNAAIDQRLIADQALGLADDFNPTRSGYVRVNILRLREALERYYAGVGHHDPTLFQISRGPYRLIATRVAAADGAIAPEAARDARRRLPTLLVVEPEVIRGEDGYPDPDRLRRKVAVFLTSQLVESMIVTACGPLRRDLFPDGDEQLPAHAVRLGYDYVATSEIHSARNRWTIRMAVIDSEAGTRVAEATGSVAAPHDGELAPAATAAAGWLFHKIGDFFVLRSAGVEKVASAKKTR